jgi:hypothetical protein
VSLPAALLDAPGSEVEAIGSAVERELAALTGGLGIPVAPKAALTVTEPDAADEPLRISLAGRECRFPPELFAQAMAYVAATPEVPVDEDAALAAARALETGAEVAELVSLVCRAAVSAQPGALLGPDASPEALEAVELGIPVGDRDGGGIGIEIDPAYLYAIVEEDADHGYFPFLRDGLFVELGLSLPPIHFRPEATLRPSSFAFRVNSIRTLPQIGLAQGEILVNDTPERLALLGIDARPTLNPATLLPFAIAQEEHAETLEAAGLTTWKPFAFLILSLASAVRGHADALMTRQAATAMLDKLALAFPALTEAARAHVPLDVLVTVLRDLLRDQLSVRNLRRILELLLRHDGAEDSPGGDPVAFVRSGLSDATAFKLSPGSGTVVVYLLDPELERAVATRAGALADRGYGLHEEVSLAVRAEVGHLSPAVKRPALLTHDELRRPIREMLRAEFPTMTVIGYGDLPSAANVQPVARIALR